MLEHGDVAEGGEHRDVLDAYRMFAYDRGWSSQARRRPSLTGLTAEAAVERVQSDNRARMLRQTDPYLRERLHDLDDLANRLLRQLLGRDHARRRASNCRKTPSSWPVPWDRVRCSTTTASACAPSLLEEGGPTSHVAIVARGRSALRRWARSTMPSGWSIRAMPSSSMAPAAMSTSARRRTSKPPISNGCGCRRRQPTAVFRAARQALP